MDDGIFPDIPDLLLVLEDESKKDGEDGCEEEMELIDEDS